MTVRTRIVQVTAATVIASAMAFIGPWEEKRNIPYLDPVGVPTACFGFTNGVDMNKIYTDDECYSLLDKETRSAAAAVDRLTLRELPPHPKAAAISFVYNVGPTNFANSAMLRKFNSGDIIGACNSLTDKRISKTTGKCIGYGCGWSKGKMLRGLVERRKAERELCLGGMERSIAQN